MTRKELFDYIKSIEDPVKDYGKILSNLHYTHYFLLDNYKKILDNYNLTFTQSNVLGIIAHFHPGAVSLEEIKAMVLEPGSDVSRTVTRLKEKGFVEKVLNEKNNRKVSIKISAKGLKTINKMDSDPRFKEYTSGTTLSESRAFIKYLVKLRKEH